MTQPNRLTVADLSSLAALPTEELRRLHREHRLVTAWVERVPTGPEWLGPRCQGGLYVLILGPAQCGGRPPPTPNGKNVVASSIEPEMRWVFCVDIG